jgi:hypothetical protein
MSASGRLVVAARLLLLLVAAGGVAASIVVSVRAARTAEASAAFVCPMHPEVRGQAPGRCPLCGMPLSKTRSPPATSFVDTTAIDNIRRHRITDVVRQRSLLFDARELRGAAWVEDGLVNALYYDDQIEVLPPGEQGWFSPSQAPQSPVPVRRTTDAKVRWDPSTSRIRFRVEGAAPAPGAVGWVEVTRKPREVLTVPASAVLQSAQGPYVLVPAGGHRFEKRSIEIGETFSKQKFAVVLSGLRLFEPVVSRASFFLDADRRVAAAEDKP